MELIDTHCHIYLPEFSNDIQQVITNATTAGVQKMYLPAIDSTVINDMLALEQQYPNVCIPMMGLHPCSVKENFLQELHIVQEWLSKRSFTAIGEIGLDFYWDTTYTKQQYHAFEQQMQWALTYDMPIVIHTRNAMQQTIDCVKPFALNGLKGIFHCFGDSYAMAKQILDMDFLLGIGGVLTYQKSGLQETLQKIDVKYMVLETDAPYLTPVPYRGKRNESSYLTIIAQKLAEVKQVSMEEVALLTTANAQKIFGN